MKKVISIFFIATLIISGCQKPKISYPNLQLTPAYVESGSLQNKSTSQTGYNPNSEILVFNSGGHFDSNHKAVGEVSKLETSSQCKKNAYIDKFGNIFAFEGGTIPSVFQNINYLNNQLYLAHWSSSYTYYLPQDALVCDKNPVFTFRPAGYYLRKETVINGIKVFKIRNEEFKEDYTNFGDYHLYANRSESQEVDLFSKLGLNPSNYDVVTSRAGLKVIGGKIKRALSTPTVKNTIDKITFVPKIAGYEKYQLRVILLKKETISSATIYDLFEETKDDKLPALRLKRTADDLYRYLNSNFVGDFRLGIIRGFECNTCQNKNLKMANIDEGRPPLPITDL